MSAPWFHQPDLVAQAPSGLVRLVDTEARHLAQVLRRDVGDEVTLFDGAGLLVQGAVAAVGKRDVSIRVVAATLVPRPARQLHLWVALPKGERADWLVEKCTELGVASLTPLRTVRSVVDARDSKLDRLRQLVIAGCKQSHSAWAMELCPTRDLSNLTEGPGVIVLEPAGDTPCDQSLADPTSVTAIIGPEGGFASEELDRLRAAGVPIVRLPTPVLRVETAALAFSAWWQLSTPP